jgi:flagellin-like hook-associated protein FlgL
MSGWAVIYNNTRAMLRYQGQEIARLQEMAASGARVIRPSDAPTDAFRILQFRAEVRQLNSYAANLAFATDIGNVASTVFQSLTTMIADARQLASQVASGTYSDDDRQPVVRQIDSMLEQAVSLANTSYQGRFLMGGGATREAPFVIRRNESGTITAVDYRGGHETLAVPVAGGVSYGTVLAGDRALRSDERLPPEFFGTTGVRAGAGTSNVRGDLWLTLAHAATVYAGGSGVAAGDSSVSADTILGTGHTLTIDQPAGTIRLDDGTAIAFTGAETDLELTSAAGDRVRVNVTGIAAGFQGTVAATATGTMSLDGGATTVPIAFGANEAVTDPATGRVLYVDTSAVERAGAAPGRVYGTYDLFEALISVRDAIANPRGMAEAGHTEQMGEALEVLAEAGRRLSQTLTTNGAQLQAMAGLKETLTDLRAISEGQADAMENADIVDVASDLARRQVLYQMALTSAARLLSMSLLDYL